MKLDVFKANLKYWEEEYKKSTSKERNLHCLKMIKRAKKKIENPENYSGY